MSDKRYSVYAQVLGRFNTSANMETEPIFTKEQAEAIAEIIEFVMENGDELEEISTDVWEKQDE